MSKKSIIILSFLLVSPWVISQKVFDTNNVFYPSVGLSVQKHLFGEISLCYGSGDLVGGNCGSNDLFFSKIGSEFSFDNKNLILGPKFSFEYVFAIFGARLNIIDYTDFKLQDWRFTPEIGFSLSAVIDIYYGYNIPLTENRISSVSENRITLTINLPRLL